MMSLAKNPVDIVRWAHDTFGMHQQSAEIEAFAEWVAGQHFRHVLEIGSLKGGTAAMLCQLVDGMVISVDLPSGRFGADHHGYDEAKMLERNMRLRDECARFIGLLGDSKDVTIRSAVANTLAGEKLDLLFIDGDHTFEGVKSDFELYRGFVKPGGYVAFHDVEETDVHKKAGCVVHDFWRALKLDFANTFEFNAHMTWGGIGVVQV